MPYKNEIPGSFVKMIYTYPGSVAVHISVFMQDKGKQQSYTGYEIAHFLNEASSNPKLKISDENVKNILNDAKGTLHYNKLKKEYEYNEDPTRKFSPISSVTNFYQRNFYRRPGDARRKSVTRPDCAGYKVKQGEIAVQKQPLITDGLFTCVGFYVSQGELNMLSHVDALTDKRRLVACIKKYFNLDKPLKIILANANEYDVPPAVPLCYTSQQARDVCLDAIQDIYSLKSMALAKQKVSEFYTVNGGFMANVEFGSGYAYATTQRKMTAGFFPVKQRENDERTVKRKHASSSAANVSRLKKKQRNPSCGLLSP